MSFSYANGLLTVLGIVFLCILVFVLPHLRMSTVYRAATLFAGLNAGILTVSLALHDWAVTGRVDREGLTKFLVATLPKWYIASLVIGAAIIPKFILSASTQLRAIIFGLLGATAYYFLAIAISNVAGFLQYIYLESPLSSGVILNIFIDTVVRILHFDRYLTTAMIVSALVSMLGTVATIQKTEGLNRRMK
jgi:hypothetical protein